MLPADHLKSLLVLMLLCVPMLARGLSSDRDQPINIEADRATLQEQKGISTYEGNVYVSQGTLKLHGDIMTVYTPGNQLEKIILLGQPATFVQRPDGRDDDLHAESTQMEYRAADERIILTGGARVWQTDGHEFRSEKIIYNIKSNTVNAGSDTGGDRVHITLQPKQRESREEDKP